MDGMYDQWDLGLWFSGTRVELEVSQEVSRDVARVTMLMCSQAPTEARRVELFPMLGVRTANEQNVDAVVIKATEPLHSHAPVGHFPVRLTTRVHVGRALDFSTSGSRAESRRTG